MMDRDPIARLLADVDRPMAPSTEFADALLERLLADLKRVSGGEGHQGAPVVLDPAPQPDEHVDPPFRRGATPRTTVIHSLWPYLDFASVAAVIVLLAGVLGFALSDQGQLLSSLGFRSQEDSADWPHFRGGVERTGAFSGEALAKAPALSWSVTLGTRLTNPIVADGTIYVRGAGVLYPVNLADGSQRWRFDIGSTPGDDSYAAPAWADGTVYIGSSTGALYALDVETGHPRWTFTAGAEVGSSPAIVGGVVYVGSKDGNTYALDAADGTQRWVAATGPIWFSSPAVAGNTVYVVNETGTLYALDMDDGGTRWTADPGSPGRTPVVTGGLVYLGTTSGVVVAHDVATGEERWRRAIGAELRDLAVADDVVYAATTFRTLVALDAATGDLRWQVTAPAVLSMPSVLSDVVLAGSPGRGVFGFDAATGEERFRLDTGPVQVGVALADGVIVVASSDTTLAVFRFDPAADG